MNPIAIIASPGHSASAQRLKDVDIVQRFQSRIKAPHLFAVDENFHVRPDRILLVNHAKAYARELMVQIVKHFGYGRATRFNIVPLIRVGQQRAWNVDLHIAPDKELKWRMEDQRAPASILHPLYISAASIA
jgi:hypothetical protein